MSAEKSLQRIFPLGPFEVQRLRQEMINEIAQLKSVSSRGKSRQRAVKRKLKKWKIKKDFSTIIIQSTPIVQFK